MIPLRSLPFLLTLTLLTCLPVIAADYIWIEGEDALTHNMRRHGWYDDVTKSALSGQNWLSHFQDGTPPEAQYRVDVPASGDYHFWIRCNPVASPRLSFQHGSEPWTEVDLKQSTGQANIASDSKPDMRFIAWVNAGKLALEKGPQSIRFRFHSANNNHGAIDCFLLSPEPFRPNGTLKPGQRSGRADPGFFAWEPATDLFSPTALVDLRSLNEDIAGQAGRVRALNNDFLLGDGRKVKFWAVNAGPSIWSLDHDAHVYLAKRLAKTGVNMVRLHGGINNGNTPTIHEKRLDDLHHLVHALKEEGIYVELSFFFPLWFQLDPGQNSFMVLFFDPEMQAIYFNWADRLLKSINPYTRIPLGKDPAVAVVEIVNEDSHFFWTFNRKNTTAERWTLLQKEYGDWLKLRHGSIEKTYQAWNGVTDPKDDPANGRIELLDAWHMTSQGTPGTSNRKERVSDQIRFLTANMQEFYQTTIQHFRVHCGYGGLVSCGNWHVTDPARLDALERYCYTAGDVIDHHGYFDHGHKGNAASYSVRAGHQFTSQSALHLRDSNPVPYVETGGHPHIISEIGWPTPNVYRAEATFITSTYGSLQGLDGIFNFAVGSEGWDAGMSKFPINTPVTLGTFPAAALIYRRGDVEESKPIAMEHLDVEKLYQLNGSRLTVKPAFDQFRAASIPPGQRMTGEVAGIDPMTFYAGRVGRSFKGKPEDSFQHSTAGLIDRNAKLIRSSTGQLSLNYDKGVATMNTPRAQGAAGFLASTGPITLDNVTIQMKNDYGTVTVVALDDKPISDSRRILIQTMTIEQPYGFKASGNQNRSGEIQSVGSAPWGVEKFNASVTLKLSGQPPAKVTACDEHGYPTGKKVPTSGPANAFKVTLNESSPYHVIER